MRRTHIHFAKGLPEKVPPLDPDFQSKSRPKFEKEDGVISGMRYECVVMIWVDVKKSLEGGVKWWRSHNNVILTEGIGEPKMLGFEWFQWVEMRGSGKILYGSKVETDEVVEIEKGMDRLGIGLGDGGEDSHDKVDGGKAPQEKVKGEKVPQEKAANGKEKPESAAAVKDHWWDD